MKPGNTSPQQPKRWQQITQVLAALLALWAFLRFNPMEGEGDTTHLWQLTAQTDLDEAANF